MVCIVMFLFSYVNNSMFWHGHSAQGFWSFHSHLADKAHRTSHTDGSHTAGAFVLLAAANQASCTDAAVPAFDLDPLRKPESRMEALPVAQEQRGVVFRFTLRGPPVLV